MRKPSPLVILGQLSLLTLALVSCGGQQVGVPVQPEQASTQAAQIVTVKVRAGTTQADLLSRYPGARMLSLHADEGYAQLLATPQSIAAPVMSGLSLSAQALAVVATEPDLTLNTSVTGDEAVAQGNTAWAGGNTAWAGGNTAWAGGISGTGGNSALLDNAAAWTKIDLGAGQKADPRLGQGVIVAVLDTGVDSKHPAFTGHLNTALGWDYVGNDADPQDENWASGSGKSFGHGTAVAGIILQVAPNATIVPYRVLNPNGGGRLSNIILAVNDAVSKGAKVINMSLGTTTASAALNNAVSSAIKSGAMVVASSGNSGDDNITYPARSSLDMQLILGGGLLSVGSIGKEDDKKDDFSTYGLGIDVMAPGRAVATAFPGGLRTNATGTSFAAPMVSGAVALAMSNGRTNVVALYTSIKATASASTDPIYGGKLGKGTLNVGKMMVSK
jgi:thermitase